MVIIKKIIPFEKELLFKTKVCEITSISLEHTIESKSEDLISGNFHINGDYKMTEGSINREKFDYDVSFDIALDSRYDTQNMVIDIDDFTYQIINDEILKVKIELYIDGDILKDDKIDTVIETNPQNDLIAHPIEVEEVIRKKEDIEIMPKLDDKEDQTTSILSTNISEDIKRNDVITSIDNTNIFGNINDNETYSTYRIYIAKEDDTIEKIIEKYSIDKEILASYNDIQTINAGDKIIIPTIFNG